MPPAFVAREEVPSMEQERRDTAADRPAQTYGQGTGEHEPAIPKEEADDPITGYSQGTLDEPGTSLTREEEGMDR